ncbi:SET domain protein 35 [Raphanus sativus]|uniref:Methyltransferase FGSG_00040 n=1 Tax=Raphanus sativus TaxID=3726 RepID=A0A6J0ML09_RAPSA|nr:methyltransferase FGSG_00040 [Raphanus sativus]KAJ4916576.1 SET domain protein 35 [Raphanus sativus]
MEGEQFEQQEDREGSSPELLQSLRSKATEHLLREEWEESIHLYTKYIDLSRTQITNLAGSDPDTVPKVRKSLCLALCNRAEARARLHDSSEAMRDCDQALEIENTHFKTLLCKGKVLLALSRYSSALECFKTALLDPQASESVTAYVEKCKKLEFQAKTGAFDLSDWVLSGFRGRTPELAEFIGSIEIKKSEFSGRGLFATKNIVTGALILVTKGVATERGILGSEKAQMVMWKNFVDEVTKSVRRCDRTRRLVSSLSTGEEEDTLEVPDVSLYMPEEEAFETCGDDSSLDMEKLLSILDVNSLVEEAVSAKVMGKNKEYYGVGLWTLPSFINHSCVPNARRLHVGDYAIVHASRDIKAGEEITSAYYDVLSSPLEKRKEMAESWGFSCKCSRCKFESVLSVANQEIREFETGLERGVDAGNAVYMVEEGMKRWKVKGKDKGLLRASYWGVYEEVYNSERLMRRWGRKVPSMEVVVDSVCDVVGSDERLLKLVVEGMKKKNGGCSSNIAEMERVLKLGKGVYGKVVSKKKAMKTLLGLE